MKPFPQTANLSRWHFDYFRSAVIELSLAMAHEEIPSKI